MRLITLLSFLLLLNVGFSQGLEEEIGFVYTKAVYLMDTDRVEDAVKELNKVISKDPKYKDALLLRAEAKYSLGAYLGVRKDLNQYISTNGITPRVARLYGLTDYQSGKKDAALNSLNIALAFIKDDKELFETRGQLYEDKGTLVKACSDYVAAAKLGSSFGKRMARTLCGENLKEDRPSKETGRDKIKINKPKNDRSTKPDRDKVIVVDDEIELNDKSNEREDPMDEMEDSEDEVMDEVIVDVVAEDNTVNTVKVDEDLTLLISGEGIGSRDITKQPNILIISEESGDVAINICVSQGGRVTKATFDNINSTIRKQSLVSLALRKAKEFWFESSTKNESCGTIVFRIHGS